MVALGLGELCAYGDRKLISAFLLLVCIWCGINYIFDKKFISPGRCILGAICLFIGYFLMYERCMEYEEAEKKFLSDIHYVTGRVVDIGNTSEGYAFTIKQSENKNVLIYSKDKKGIKIGNIIHAEVNYIAYEGARNNGCFNDRQYYRSIGIFGRFYSNSIDIRNNKVFTLKQKMYYIKGRVKDLLRLIYSEDKAAVFDAMLLGDKTGINEEAAELYKGAGIYHLCCISGTHMALVGLGIYRLFRKRYKFTVSGIIAIMSVFIYGVFTGMMISVLRAVIMLSVRIAADMLGRSYDMLSSMSLAAIVIITCNPYALFNSGFMFSFGAVFAICTIVPATEIIYSVKSRFLKSILFSFGIQLMTLPIMAFYFFQISIYGVIINLIAIPFIVYIILSGMGGVIGSILDLKIGRFMAGAGKYGLDFYNSLCRLTLRMPFSEYVTGKPDIWRIVIYYAFLMITVFITWKLCNRETEFTEEFWYIRYGKIVGGLSMIFILCFILLSGKNKGISVKFIDVGQGDSTLIQIDRKVEYLIDAGSSSINQVGKYRIIPVLKANGVAQLDYLIVTHTDNDHINGIEELMKERIGSRAFVKTLVLPDIWEKDEDYIRLENLAMENNVSIEYISAGKGWEGKDYRLECLYPYKGLIDNDKNELSTVIRLTACNSDIMFMGDLGKKGEDNLITSGLLKKCSILKAGHHGSKNSSSFEFLDIIRPPVSIISCGKGNTYGHPSIETVNRLDNVHSRIYRTDKNGEIDVYFRENCIKVDSYFK